MKWNLYVAMSDQSQLDSEPPFLVISKKEIGLSVIVRRAAKHAYDAASFSSSNFNEMIPLKCSLMSISLSWEYIVYDLLFKQSSCFYHYSRMKLHIVIILGNTVP